MATTEDFKSIAGKQLKIAEFLMSNKEWGMTAYVLGFVLECVLKASACKALNLTMYPEIKKTKNQNIINYFRTHDFDMLLVVSGTSDIFDLSSGKGASSWSGFTQEYTKVGKWTNIRYETMEQFDENTIKGMYKYLTEKPNGIIPLIEERKRW